MISDVKLTAIVAMSDNRCIGSGNDLPWHISDDLKRFKRLTLGKPVIMGRKTFESILNRIGKPLPGRTNIIITRQDIEISGAIVTHDLEDAIEAAKDIAAKDDIHEIIIGGGAQIYKQALPMIDQLHLTVVHTNINGDAWFPMLDISEWTIAEEEYHHASEGQHPAYTNKLMTRKN